MVGGGRIYTTGDGAQTWSSQKEDAPDLGAVAALDAMTVVAVGENDTVARTVDGGATWSFQRIGSSTPNTLNDITFVDPANGWAVGDKGTIMHTSDGGASWVQQDSGTDEPLSAVAFVDADHGWAVGGRPIMWDTIGVVLTTSDGGATWTSVDSGILHEAPSFDSVSFTDPLHGWITGARWGREGLVQVTSDGGASWTAREPVDDVFIDSVLVDENAGFGLTENSVFSTNDGGVSWSVQRLVDSYTGLYDMWFSDPLHGWVVGALDVLRTVDGGQTWSVAREHFSGGYRRAIAFSGLSDGWIVGGLGEVGVTHDGGQTWSWLGTAPLPAPLRAVTVVDSAHAWAAGENGTVMFAAAKAAALTTLESPSTPWAGSSMTLAATVTSNNSTFIGSYPPSSGVPTGQVEFTQDGVVIGLAAVSGGTATLETPALAAGHHAFGATYLGDEIFDRSDPVALRVEAGRRTVGWGLGHVGQLGNGSTANSSTPVLSSGITGIVDDLAAGAYHSLAVQRDGTLRTSG